MLMFFGEREPIEATIRSRDERERELEEEEMTTERHDNDDNKRDQRPVAPRLNCVAPGQEMAPFLKKHFKSSTTSIFFFFFLFLGVENNRVGRGR